MTPYLSDPDITLYNGDALEVLRELPDKSVHMCATSPPFYGLRDYQVEGQIGLEESPDEWVARLVEVFREVRRVLRDDGTLWVEIGDSYAANGRYGDKNEANPDRVTEGRDTRWALSSEQKHARAARDYGRRTSRQRLVGQPWLLAFALRADGWYLRSEIIWARPNPMPESVTDRPTKAHSTVFLLSKMPRYYFDAEAIREPYAARGFVEPWSLHEFAVARRSRASRHPRRLRRRSPPRSRRTPRHRRKGRRELRAAPRRRTLACLGCQRPLRLDDPHRANPFRPLRHLAAEARAPDDPGGNASAGCARSAGGRGCGRQAPA